MRNRVSRVGEHLRQNLWGVVAVFIALGGTASALPGKNTVDSRDIKPGQVRTSDLRNGAVTGEKLAAGSVDSETVADGSLLASDFLTGQLPAGEQGPPGPAGPTGPRGPSNLVAGVDDQVFLPTCAGNDLTLCSDALAITLPESTGGWLIQAEFNLNNDGPQASTLCGIVDGPTVRDQARLVLAANAFPGESESIVMSVAIDEAPANTTIGLRCREETGENLVISDALVTALQVETVTGN